MATKTSGALSGALSGATAGASIGGPWGAAIGGVAGGLMGYMGGNDDAAKAAAARDEAARQMQAVTTPSIEDMKVALQKYQVTDVMTPEMEQAINLGQSDLKNIQDNPEIARIQMSNLQKMAGMADQGGLDAESRAKLDDVLRASETQQMSNQKAILENRAARGMAGSGDELAAQLQASQSGANRASQESRAVAALALQNQMNALQGSSSLASNLDAQQYAKAKAAADATDSISRFNAQNQQNVANTNVQNRNTAQMANLNNQQSISNSNVDTANRQETANKGLYQQDFVNRLNKAGGTSNALNTQANGLQASSDANGAMIGGIGSGLIKAAGAFGTKSSTPDLTDNNNVDSTNWMDALKAKGKS